jgi:type IV pilus assembly protein PilM
MIQSLWGRIKPSRSSIGLEITEDEVKLCELEAGSGGQIRILQHASLALPKGTMNDGRVENREALEATLREVLARHRWGTRRVHLAIPSQMVLVKTIRLPDVPDKQLDKLVRYELSHHMTLPFERPHYAYTRLGCSADLADGSRPRRLNAPHQQSAPPEPVKKKPDPLAWAKQEIKLSELFGRSKAKREAAPAAEAPAGTLSEVLVVAAPLDMLEEYVRLLSRLQLQPESFEIKAFSLMRLQEWCLPLGGEESWILVDVHASNTDLTIVDHGLLRLTRNMEIRFPGDSERRSTGEAAGSEELDGGFVYGAFPEPRPSFENACQDLLSELERLLNFYRYSLDNRNLEFPAIVLTGSLGRMDALEDYLYTRTSQRIYRYKSDPGVGPTGLMGMAIDLSANAVPIGLALRGRRG